MDKRSDVAVVICAYTEQRWNDLVAAVRSVQEQSVPAREIIVVIDHNPKLLARALSAFTIARVVENRETRGVSGARNSGVAASTSSIVAFLDDDAEALPDWIEHMIAGYEEANVLGVGGFIEPVWLSGRPAWFPEEFFWVVGGSYRGMPEQRTAVRNLWTGNMSVRRAVFQSIGGFRTGFGKLGTQSRPEDTEFCIRAAQQWPGHSWLYEPRARVRHKVPAQRAGWRYFLRRCYAEGQGKADLAGLVGARDGLAAESRHMLRTLPAGVIRGIIRAVVRREPESLACSAAILTGLAVTGLGYVKGMTTIGSLRAGGPIRSGNVH